jgi:hypothetical protein
LEGEHLLKIKTLFTITAVFFFINALIALITPETQLSLYEVTTGPGEKYMAQWAGLGSITVALIAFFARDFTESEARRSIVFTLTIYFIIGFVISITGTLSGLMGTIGWSLVIVCFMFAVGYGYFLFKRTNN